MLTDRKVNGARVCGKMNYFPKTPLKIAKTGDDSPASSILGYVWRMSGWHQVVACLAAVLLTLLNLVPLELQRRIVNEVVETQDLQQLYLFGGIYVAVVLMHQAVKFSLRIYQSWLTESATVYTRSHLINLYADGIESEEDDTGGRTVSIVGSEVEKLGGFVGEAISQACANISMLLGVLTYMLVIEPMIALFALAVLFPQVILTPVIQRRLNDLVEIRIGYLRDLGDEISDMDKKTNEHRLSVVNDIYKNRMKFFVLKFFMKSLLNLLNSLGPISVLLFGGYMVMQGETQVGVIVAFLSGFDRLASPVRELIGFYRVAAQAAVQHRLIAKWMSKR
jgi:ABC-type bacteriocin/lantibiotic exporter with double-glycine peptidase domain